MACISPTACSQKANHDKGNDELNECLTMERARKKVDNDIESKDSIELNNSDHHAESYLTTRYYISDKLTEKSDVYSFGVVLLELMTCKPVIKKSQERAHISQWVSFMLAKADIKNIVHPRLQGDFDINSVRKAVEIAMACISPTATKRPTMTKVVIELNECLEMEIARKKVDNEIESKDSIELYNSDHHAELYLTTR